MKIALDVDGVLLDTEELWTVIAEIYDAKTLDRNSLKDRSRAKVNERYDWSESECQTYYDSCLNIEDFDIVPGSKIALKTLKDEGHEFISISAKGLLEPTGHAIAIAEQKFKQAGFPISKSYWKIKDKLPVALDEKVGLAIDDNLDLCRAFADAGIKTLYFRTFNSAPLKHRNVTYVSNWGEAYRAIHEYAKELKNN